MTNVINRRQSSILSILHFAFLYLALFNSFYRDHFDFGMKQVALMLKKCEHLWCRKTFSSFSVLDAFLMPLLINDIR